VSDIGRTESKPSGTGGAVRRTSAALVHGGARAVDGETFRARVALVYLSGFGAFGLGVSTLYAVTGVGFVCPFRAITGWQCPLCGGTRLGNALLHGDLPAAFAYNPVVFLGLAALLLLGVAWTVEALHGPALRPPRAWRARLRRVTPSTWLGISLVMAVCYTVLRNLS
jgi:Protein of unknown function (DUF2752)